MGTLASLLWAPSLPPSKKITDLFSAMKDNVSDAGTGADKTDPLKKIDLLSAEAERTVAACCDNTGIFMRKWREYCALAIGDRTWMQEMEPSVRGMIENQIDALNRAEMLASMYEKVGKPLQSADRITRAKEQIQTIREQIFERWPLSTDELARCYPLDMPPLYHVTATKTLFDLFVRWPRYQSAAPVLLAAGALTAVLGDWLAIAPLWGGFLLGFLSAAIVTAIAFSSDW